jgi:ubiquinone/menaquinone biosynthesis C-methylase UbiE
MNLYSQIIFPWCMDLSMSCPVLSGYRQQILEGVSGKVLEIGFGTGLNLKYYPQSVQKLTVIDSNQGMNRLAKKRIQSSAIDVNFQILKAEKLPDTDATFDSVVSTWTLCSIANVESAIAEIYRVLKPGGKFFFIEHGLSNELNVQTWQNLLNPLQKIVGDGCHLNRNIKQLVANNFKDITIEEFYASDLPKFIGYMYKGIAIK